MDMKTNQKGKSSEKKKRLIKTKSETLRLKAIILSAIVLVAVALYLLIDSRSYVASVAGNRIMTYEYKFLLRQQVINTEQEEGIYTKTDAERKAYWMNTEGGQNPWETAKNETLNTAKEYVIQMIKARELGLSIDASMKSEVNQFIKSFQGETPDNTFAKYVEGAIGVSLDQYRKMLENAKLIEKFKKEYIKHNYKPEALTDNDIKAFYEKDTKLYDTVDIRYVIFSKLDETGQGITADEIAQKKIKAEEALAKIQGGEDIEKIIKEYTEEKPAADQPDEPLGQAPVAYSEDPSVQAINDFVFGNEVGKSGIAETDNAIYVIKIIDRTDFEDVKADVKAYMERTNETQYYNDALKSWSMEAKYNIIKNDPVYDSIKYAMLFPNQ